MVLGKPYFWHIYAASLIKVNRSALRTKVIDELRVFNESDGDVVALERYGTPKDVIKCFVLVALNPNLC